MIRSLAPLLRRWFLLVLAGLATAPLDATSDSPLPTTVAGWEELAVQEFPELRVTRSEFNRLFLEQVDLFRETKPETFQDPSWPYRIALWVSQWFTLKKEAQSAQTEALKIASPSRFARPPHAVVSAQGEKSRPLNELCRDILREKLKSGHIRGQEGDWIQGDHIERGKKIEALYLSSQTSPEVIPAVRDFVANALQRLSPNLSEDCDWLKAILQTPTNKIGTADTNPPLHHNLASLLGIEDTDLVLALLVEIGDANFAEDYLYGRVLSRIDTAAPSRKLRTQLIEKLLREGLRLGPWTLSKANCVEFLFSGADQSGIALLGGGNFEMLEYFEIHDWPESLFRSTRAPGHPFNKSDREWQDYLEILQAFWLNLSQGKWPFSGLSIPGKVAAPGKLEHYLLWHCSRLRDPKVASDWLKEVRQHILKSSTPGLRARAEIIPAIEHVLSEKFDPSPR